MKLKLEPPFDTDWKHAYLRESKIDKRKRVDLVNSNSDRTTISYARYLVSVREGRYLTDDEEVDHHDTDCTNDDLSNLILMSKAEHLEKTTKENTTGRTHSECVCAYCGTIFLREKRNVKKNPNQMNVFCSRSCNGKFYFSSGFNNK